MCYVQSLRRDSLGKGKASGASRIALQKMGSRRFARADGLGTLANGLYASKIALAGKADCLTRQTLLPCPLMKKFHSDGGPKEWGSGPRQHSRHST
ncbi:hypothetical protein Pla8534_65730 [Lignipirellula cremea]|uniref:Uncharacterized protein n=1 Tax=Lignipirellula cremea TaxID=2528010 RepID=A0A518E3M9_9BACT|nr:hypothetical protein Pla8534_65730 [Lignipirellula cremea]